ncbi:MAG: beta-propeller fold lactonase family protein [Planctomycetota bacterium]|nr:beta-propeller fold lactonase family protein [Planctomycetota bacterium]
MRVVALFVGAMTSIACGQEMSTISPNSVQKPSTAFAGPTQTGFLLPNGWHLTPAGRHIVTNDLVLNLIPLSDGRRALASCDGFNEHYLGLFDLADGKLLSKQSVTQSWFGLQVSKDEKKIWWSGGGAGDLHLFDLNEQSLTRISPDEVDTKRLTREEQKALREKMKADNAFRSGICLDEGRNCLYSLLINAGKLVSTSLNDGIERSVVLGGRPYDIKLSRDQRLLYVSDWADSIVRVIDAEALRIVDTIRVGEHPNQIAVHPKDNRVFVTCASSNGVWVIDAVKGVVTETIYTSLFPQSPEGSTPDALALSPDGLKLYVANADNNCIAVINIESANRSVVEGFVPTGWYPTSVAVTPDSKSLLVGVGKGNQSRANPITKDQPADEKPADSAISSARVLPYPYIGTTMSGAVSIVELPNEDQLKKYTQQVYQNCPYSDRLLSGTLTDVDTAIPKKVGDESPIKYVIYVIKENRTYDQVFGDLASGPNPKGNGDPSLCMFPRRITPNHHKLAEEFVLLDNLYCNGQVSRDGHPWSTMAYNTDYVARDWHLTYSRRVGVDDDDEGDLANSPSGYIWDACLRAGVSYRSYKEYGGRVSDEEGNQKMEGRVPGLIGHMCPDYGIGKPGVRERDMDLVEIMLAEYRQFAQNKNMPQFIIMSLGEDHTDGTRPGSFTPEACVGSNDQALGKLVEAVSSGPLWNQTAIFVIEDDAQNGPDHVDAHRTVSLVISPYTKRGYVDSTQYSTVSMIRTMELILGLQPLSQYDAAARPMYDSFTNTPNLSPYSRVEPQIDLYAKNSATAYGADRSLNMDFTEYDRIDDFELNEILWRSVMGVDAPIPPAVRRALAFRTATR